MFSLNYGTEHGICDQANSSLLDDAIRGFVSIREPIRTAWNAGKAAMPSHGMCAGRAASQIAGLSLMGPEIQELRRDAHRRRHVRRRGQQRRRRPAAEAGHEVIGVTLQLYDHGAATGRKGACCAGQDIHDARRVADRLGIAALRDRRRGAVPRRRDRPISPTATPPARPRCPACAATRR